MLSHGHTIHAKLLSNTRYQLPETSSQRLLGRRADPSSSKATRPPQPLVHFKLKKTELETQGSDAELGPVVDALRDDLDDTRAQLADVQERLDFAERVLTAGRASQEDKSG